MATIQDETVNRLKRHITNEAIIGSATIMVFIIFWSFWIAGIIEDRIVSKVSIRCHQHTLQLEGE